MRDVDEYIASAPRDMQARLRELRAAIKAAAPDARERISYGMPYYECRGRLVYFSLWKRHVALYALTGPVLEEHRSELEGYVTAKGTIRFPLDEALPTALVERLVRAQVKRNDEADAKQ